jgi:hypothetical protein
MTTAGFYARSSLRSNAMTLSVPRAGGHRGHTHSGPFARVVENNYRYVEITLSLPDSGWSADNPELPQSTIDEH